MPNLIEPQDNPFQMVYDAIWESVESDKRFNGLIKLGNRIKFENRSQATQLEHTTSSDFPRLQLRCGPIIGNLRNTSSSSKLIREYTWVIESGDFVYSTITPIEWTLIVNAVNWCTALTHLVWKEEHFVKRTNLVLGSIDRIEKEFREKNINTFFSVVTTEVEMHFATANLLPP